MKPRRAACLLALCCLLSPPVTAQREWPGVPPSRDPRIARRLGAVVPLRRLERVDVDALRAEDATRAKGAPLRYGVVVPLELSCDESGCWDELPDGGRLWRQEVASEGARSLGLVFRRFQLPVGAELWVQDASGSVLHGAYTHENHGPQGRFAVQPIPGDRLRLELRLPAGAPPPELRLAAVVHDYLGVLELLDKSGGDQKATACELDVVCRSSGWEDPIDAVLRVLSGGLLCSGALVSNTAGDGSQLFLSAEHCGDLGNGVFYFNYQRSICGAGSAPANLTVQGSVELARSTTWDVQLVRLTEPIPDAFDAYLAGWDRSGAIPSSTTTIHHPGGGPKKISFDRDPPRRPGTQWRILQWDEGVTEPGSSGSPLFSPQGLLIGQLCCGAAACGYPYDDYYGRLDAEWSLLAPWLDPLGSGVQSSPGMRLAGHAPEPFSVSSVDPPSVGALDPGPGQTVRLEGTGFTGAARVLFDGADLQPASFTVVDEHSITLDMPQAAFLGRHTLTVVDQGQLGSVFVDVLELATPALQVGTGGPLPWNQVSSSQGLALVVAGPVGQLQYVLFSSSGSPSVLPAVQLCLGDGFRELEIATLLSVEGVGWTRVELPLPPLAMTLFLQSLTLQDGIPIPVSNCQEVEIVP